MRSSTPTTAVQGRRSARNWQVLNLFKRPQTAARNLGSSLWEKGACSHSGCLQLVLLLVSNLGTNAPVQTAPKTCLGCLRDTPALGTAQCQKAQGFSWALGSSFTSKESIPCLGFWHKLPWSRWLKPIVNAGAIKLAIAKTMLLVYNWG